MDTFLSFPLPSGDDLFEKLHASARFEDVGKGRQGAVLVKLDEAGGIPIVRTTTRYSAPAQPFGSVHEQLAQQIQSSASLPVGFNNALIECYTNAYTTMGGHSDQALDLAEASVIAVFSCYKNPGLATAPRRLLIESKAPGRESFELPMTHHSFIVFSVETNRRFRHKIVLDSSARTTENPWLGITFRASKTLVRIRAGQTALPDGARLTLANDEQRREFYQLRRRENNEPDFTYPRVTYTLSESDLMPPRVCL